MGSPELRAGDWVQVKGGEEIMATLDERGQLDSLPFMPEMLRYCGRRFRVAKRADKICDTSHWTGSRFLPDTVLLEDLRCDGKAHGGCQAACLLFWKERWLCRVSELAPPGPVSAGEAPLAEVELLTRNASWEVELEGKREHRYRCQATRLHDASKHLRTFDPRPYFRELRSGNVSLGRFLKVSARAAVWEPLHRLGLVSDRPMRGKRAPNTPPEPRLGLAPGDWVRVKAKEEIAATLDAKGLNRGLWFDREMARLCGKIFRVRERVQRIIEEPTGKMIQIKSDCLILESVTCSGDYSRSRWFCPRAIFPYWRECWLERVPAVSVASAATGASGSPPPNH
jgi:hypothetical protein